MGHRIWLSLINKQLTSHNMQEFHEKAVIGTWSSKLIAFKTLLAFTMLFASGPSHGQNEVISQYQWREGDCYLEFDSFKAGMPIAGLTVLERRESYQNITLFLQVDGFTHVSLQFSACHHLVTTLVFEMKSKEQLNAALDFSIPFIKTTNSRALLVIKAIWSELGITTNGGILYVGRNDHEQSILLTEIEEGYRLEL